MYATVEPQPIDTSYLEVLSDTELVRMVKSGSDNALGVLLRRHRDALYRFCLHLTQNRDDAEDVCQESLARAITRVDSLHAGSAFRSWLFSIARNLSIDSHRSRKRICPMPDEEITPLPQPLHADSPYEQVEMSEEYQTVAQALSKLKKNHQTVLMLREVEGMSYAEIAQRLDISQSAVETLLFRARKRLREEYGKTGAPLPVFAFLAHLRGLLSRLASPFSGAPLAAKVVVTAFVVGSAVVATPHALPVLKAAAAVFPLPGSPAPSAAPSVAQPAGHQSAVRHHGTARISPSGHTHTTPTGASVARGQQTRSAPTHRPAAGSSSPTSATGGNNQRSRHTGHGAPAGGASSSSVVPTIAQQAGTSHSSVTHHRGSPRSVSGTSTGKKHRSGSSSSSRSSSSSASSGSAAASSPPTAARSNASTSQPHTAVRPGYHTSTGSTSPAAPSGSTRGRRSTAAGQTSAARPQPTTKPVGSGAQAAAGTAQTAASTAATAVQSHAKGTAVQVQATVTAVSGQAQATASSAVNQAQKTASGAANQAQQAVATTTTQAQKAVGTTTSQAKTAATKTANGVNQAGNTANQAQNKAGSTASQAQHQATSTANQAQHQASNTVNQVKTVTPPAPKPTTVPVPKATVPPAPKTTAPPVPKVTAPPAPKATVAVPTALPTPVHIKHP